MLDGSGLVTTIGLNTKIGEVENKIFGLSGLVKKTGFNTKKWDNKTNCFTTSDYDKFKG